MNFDFSDEQKLLRDQAGRFLRDQATPQRVRAILEDDTTSYDAPLWHSIIELGWTGTAIPEAYGGAGLSHEELCIIAEELGRTLAPTPFSSSVYLATEALLLAGNEEQKQRWLPRLALGECIGCFAIAEAIGAPTPATLKTAVSDNRVSGCKLPVADGDVADFAVVLARSGTHASLFIVELADKGVARRSIETVDPTRSHARIEFDNASADLLGAPGDGWRLSESLFDRAAILFAFEQIGGAQACLDMGTDYAKNRYAFGRAIGSFQAIKHKLVDMYVAIELARANAYYGAWALGTDAAELPVAAAAARVAASEAFNHAARENIQTHGGMGFTWEYDCHLYYRRAKLLSLALGGERRWKDRLISQLELGNTV
ncbi:MAG: acyl-CoA dehydrogenase [Gammaproteobacteria bacterium]|jgi:acyl-CoA dehydrogenase